MACKICKKLKVDSIEHYGKLRENLVIFESSATGWSDQGFAKCRACEQQIRYDFLESRKPKLRLQFIEDEQFVPREREYKNLRFTDLGWFDNRDAYTKTLVSLAVKIAQIIEPDFSIMFLSGCNKSDHIEWNKSRSAVGYFEYYTTVAEASFKGSGAEKISVSSETGFQYESDGTDSVGITVAGLPGKYSLFLKTYLDKTVDIYIKALPKHLDILNARISRSAAEGTFNLSFPD